MAEKNQIVPEPQLEELYKDPLKEVGEEWMHWEEVMEEIDAVPANPIDVIGDRWRYWDQVMEDPKPQGLPISSLVAELEDDEDNFYQSMSDDDRIREEQEDAERWDGLS